MTRLDQMKQQLAELARKIEARRAASAPAAEVNRLSREAKKLAARIEGFEAVVMK